MPIRTYYEILGIAHDADEGEIRRGFRRAIREVHPDQNPDDRRSARRSRELNEARTTLLDAEKRRRYDEKLRRKGMFPDAPASTEADAAGNARPEADEFSFAPEWTPPQPPPYQNASAATPERDARSRSQRSQFGRPPTKPKRTRKSASDSRRVPWEFLVLLLLLAVSIGMFLFLFAPRSGRMANVAAWFKQPWIASSSSAEPEQAPAVDPVPQKRPPVDAKGPMGGSAADPGNGSAAIPNQPTGTSIKRPAKAVRRPAEAMPKFPSSNRVPVSARPRPRPGLRVPTNRAAPSRNPAPNPTQNRPASPATPDAGPEIMEAPPGEKVTVTGNKRKVIIRGDCVDLQVGGNGCEVIVESMVEGQVNISGLGHNLQIRGSVASIVGSGNGHILTVEELGAVNMSGILHRLRYVRGLGGKPVRGLPSKDPATPGSLFAEIRQLPEFPESDEDPEG